MGISTNGGLTSSVKEATGHQQLASHAIDKVRYKQIIFFNEQLS